MKKISALVVDDNPDVVGMLRLLLQREGISCETLQSGAEVVEHVEKKQHDIVFLDLVLPGVDGGTLAGLLHRKYPGLHIVVMSAQDDEGVINQVMSQGAKAYLIKPFSPEAVLNCIRNVERHRTTDELRADMMGARPPSP